MPDVSTQQNSNNFEFSSLGVLSPTLLLLSDQGTFNNNKAEGKNHSSNWEVHNIQRTMVLYC